MALTHVWPSKDPAEVLDYSIDWTARLSGDTIATSNWILDYGAGVTLGANSNTSTSTTTFVSGGTLGMTALITNRITTAGGRTLDWQMSLSIATEDTTLIIPRDRTVLDVITKAMIHIGALASGETPNANEAQDGLDAFNDVIDTWALENLMVYGSETALVYTIAGQARYTVGIGANWSVSRPVDNLDYAYCTVQGVDYPMEVWTQAEYDAVPLKTQQQTIIQRIAYINEYPLGVAYLWPTPLSAVPVKLSYRQLLTYADSVGQVVAMPPGYVRALQYAVAVELTPQYGGAIDVSTQARSTMAKIKRANSVRPIARYDPTLSGGGVPFPARGY